ncbi:disease resistance protein Roq1 isoform X1 [Lactuca sativa]|uniref:disease resistance protein Roq1 isoform X1 n=1 Tax=Lactuca sativa TaxID=4236 RepID=UPI0022AE7A82|nr:disease resistance protein Roq1 isoform X1 [Lactuca sativa]
MASSSATAPAFTSQSWKYDVFLSFRGEDTRKTFVDHLYTALEQQGIFTYKDDETLPRGESIGPSLIKAIEESQTAVIVFSENYAYSSWCLDELVHIMECKDKRGQIVIPIFYNVEPSEVKNQRRKYGEALAKHELENKNKVKTLVQTFLDDPWGWLSAPREQNKKYGKIYAKQELEYKTKIASWRQALADAGNISGCEPKQIANGHESKVIKEIVDTISQRLKLVTLGANGNLIGIAARMQALQLELQIGLGGVRMIGIWGVGGGGKTTLASSIYDEISSKFDGSCFVKNIREESSKNGLESLQENILSGVLKQKQPQVIRRIEEGRRMIQSRLCHRKLLIVLDDVDHLDQLKALAGSYDWFGEGSRIIITTRDEHVLNAHRVNVIHNIRLLNDDEAIKLFCKHAFEDDRPRKDYEQLSKDVVSYAGGLPLAIKVLGSFLCDKDMNEWRSALTRLKEIPETEIVEKLKISFDGLKGVEKELFLDIACFFRGEYKNERAMMILNACGFHPIIGLKVLIQKALINISSDGMFDMHDLVQEMGHYIVRGEHPKDPEKHSRVWKEEDLRTICAMGAMMELDMIEAIKSVLLADPINLPPIVANMKNLRWIEWNGGLANPLPTHFSPRKLCFLKLDCIRPKQLWEGYKQYLPSLRIMELHNVNNLIRTPDFDGIPNLERFRLSQCPTIKEIHPSIGCLKRLVFLSVEHCFSLEMFPPITRLKILETLTFTGCPELFKLSEIQPLNMDNFPHLHLDTSDTEVKKLQKDLTGLRLFQNGLRELVLSYCNLRDKDMSTAAWDLPNLGKLDLRSNEFSQLNFSCLQLPRVKMLDVSGCRHLVELSELHQV